MIKQTRKTSSPCFLPDRHLSYLVHVNHLLDYYLQFYDAGRGCLDIFALSGDGGSDFQHVCLLICQQGPNIDVKYPHFAEDTASLKRA